VRNDTIIGNRTSEGGIGSQWSDLLEVTIRIVTFYWGAASAFATSQIEEITAESSWPRRTSPRR
jgi:hypothetical protein